MASEQLLACPECDSTKFGFTLMQVHFGPAYEFENGTRDVEGHDQGPVIDDRINDTGVTCTNCDAQLDLEGLITVERDGE